MRMQLAPTGRPLAPDSMRQVCVALLMLGVTAIGCSSAPDWRIMRLDGTSLQVAMPCRPDRQTRVVRLDGAVVQMLMLSCSVREHTFAVATAALADPAAVPAALRALTMTAATNLQARVDSRQAAAVPGATPQDAAIRQRLYGRLPDGRAVNEAQAVFSHGTTVFQATVVATELQPALIATFFDGLKVLP